jgi:hypothetical protein
VEIVTRFLYQKAI